METGNRQRGTLVLVVGPSGAGKDTLIEAAKRRFSDDPRFAFPRRMVTRSRDAGGEDHVAVSEVAFAAAEASGALLLSWRAHGLGYGVPRTVLDDLAAGRTVVVNVSRRAVAEAEGRLDSVAVILVTASPGILARRLAARGREDETDIARRLAREARVETRRAAVLTIENDSAVEDAVAALCAHLEALSGMREESVAR